MDAQNPSRRRRKPEADSHRSGSRSNAHRTSSVGHEVRQREAVEVRATNAWGEQVRRDSIGSSDNFENLNYGFGALTVNQPDTVSPPEGTFGSFPGTQVSSSTIRPSTYSDGGIYYSPAEKITDGALLKSGHKARARVIGSKEKTEPLDPRYKRQQKPLEFFKVGRVIKVLWSEPIGFSGDNLTVVTMEQKFAGEKVAVKIRWFVVIMEGDKWCTCLPISTYGGHGLIRKDLSKWQHSVIHDRRYDWSLLHGEEPQPGERGFQLPIRVRSNDRQVTMERASRLHYAKMYTIEHNVKVFDFGTVVPEDVPVMVSQWKTVISSTPISPSSIDTSGAESSYGAHQGYAASYPAGDQHVGQTPGSAGSYGPYQGYTNPQDQTEHETLYRYAATGQSNYDQSHTGIQGTELARVPEDESEGEDDDGNEEDPPPPAYIDYAVVKKSYQPTSENQVLGHITIKRKDRLGIMETYSSGWSRAYNSTTQQTGLVWKDYITLDSQATPQ